MQIGQSTSESVSSREAFARASGDGSSRTGDDVEGFGSGGGGNGGGDGADSCDGAVCASDGGCGRGCADSSNGDVCATGGGNCGVGSGGSLDWRRFRAVTQQTQRLRQVILSHCFFEKPSCSTNTPHAPQSFAAISSPA